MTTPENHEARLTLRIPAHVHHELQQAAALNGRTVNAEILERILAYPVSEQVQDLARESQEMKGMLRNLLAVVESK